MIKLLFIIVLMTISLYGEYYGITESTFWLDVLVNAIGAFMGFGLSLFIYYSQIRRDKKKEHEQNRSNNLALLRYYQELIKSLKKSCAQQLQYVDDFIANQEKDLTWPLPMRQVATTDFTRLINVDNRGVFIAWMSIFNGEKDIEQLNKLNGILDFLQLAIEQIKTIHKSNAKECRDEFIEIKNMVEDIPNKLGVESHGRTYANRELTNFIALQQRNYMQLMDSKPSIPEVEKGFLLPLIDGFTGDFKGTPLALEILILCKKSRTKINNIEVGMKSTINNLQMAKSDIEKQLPYLDQIIEKIDSVYPHTAKSQPF